MNIIEMDIRDIGCQSMIYAKYNLSRKSVYTRRYFPESDEDNGIGIAEKYNEKIFVIFQRLHTIKNIVAQV